MLISYDRNSGKEKWRSVATTAVPHEGHHRDHGYASASPVTDGENIIVSFGSRGLYCYDIKGKVQWKKDFGDMRTRNSFGEGSSPALHGDTIVLLWDQEDDSHIYALDKKTGKVKWKRERKEAQAGAPRSSSRTMASLRFSSMAPPLSAAINQRRQTALGMWWPDRQRHPFHRRG